jgi:drug/metabolite transporter (DMT)-like permease
MLVTALPLLFLAITSIILLLFTDFNFEVSKVQLGKSSVAIAILAFIGTALSLVLFNRLIKSTTAVFASSVTYLIPIVALFWGFLDNELIGLNQVAGLGVILIAIWLIRNDR